MRKGKMTETLREESSSLLDSRKTCRFPYLLLPTEAGGNHLSKKGPQPVHLLADFVWFTSLQTSPGEAGGDPGRVGQLV
jgi:hypothetical protein